MLSTPPTDWRTSGSGKAEGPTFACGITLCGADDRLELAAEGDATSTGGASGPDDRFELGADGGATSTGGASGFGARLELGAEGAGGGATSTGASGFGAVSAEIAVAPGTIRAALRQTPVNSITE